MVTQMRSWLHIKISFQLYRPNFNNLRILAYVQGRTHYALIFLYLEIGKSKFLAFPNHDMETILITKITSVIGHLLTNNLGIQKDQLFFTCNQMIFSRDIQSFVSSLMN